MKRLTGFVGLIALFFARTALADEVEIQAAPPAPAPVLAEQPVTPPAAEQRTDLWKISAGVRTSYVTSAGFDPYSTNDVLAQGSLEAQYPLLHRGKLALAVGLGYSGGALGDKVRGDETKLAVHQLSVPIEGRYHFARWAYGFARVAPGTTAAIASLKDASSPNELSDTKWIFSTDLSAGAAILIGPRGPDQADKRTIRFWALPEFGYTFATKASFDTRPDRDPKDALGTDERTALAPLNLSAFFWRISVATTF